MSKVVLCTLCLNEIEWLQYLYDQHKNWPGLDKWVFVESADVEYARSNHTMVTNKGLSVDGTSSFLRELSEKDSRIAYIPYGFCGEGLSKDQGKCEARRQYLRYADDYKPNLLVVLDADEFYTYQDQETISDILRHSRSIKHPRLSYKGSAFCFNQRHIWYPPSIQRAPFKLVNQPYGLFSHEVKGGYWDVVHCRVWRWEPGLTYRQNHNWPEDTKGTLLVYKNEAMMRNDRKPHYSLKSMVSIGIPLPQCIHLGYASNADNRRAKHKYYIDRGEGQEPDTTIRRRRTRYVDCRHAWEAWEPGDKLPHDARVITYTGPVPEVFTEIQKTCAPIVS